ncbi:type VI secretion protein IcmF/TssM N-terminal domain-containing protein [Candidatus Cytomitobacter primus]|nr:type VI secretion protein IcmF/TssM N-terminal domain-containing protein [Candidatus Cytomitobacter primus]
MVSASTFMLLNKSYVKMPKIIAFLRKHIKSFAKYVANLFRFEAVFDDRINKSFDHNMHILYSFLGSENFKYKLPFIMVIGSERSGKSAIINSLKLERTIDDLTEKNEFCNWSFFNDAVFLEMHSALFSSGDSYVSSDASNWNKLLNTLSYHRPERPIDSLVLTISIEDILDHSINLSNIAEHYYIKLWKMQKTFKVNFPIYVVFTHTDLIPGFSHFVHAIQETLQDDIFGWSNPHSVNAIENIEFIEDGIDQIINRLMLIQQEIMAKEISSENGMFVFPFEIHKLKQRLSEFMYYIFKRNSLHDHFMLRGIYFTGSSKHNAYVNHEFSQSLQSVEFGSIVKASSLHTSDDILFTTNLFTDKIFKEKGLTFPLSGNILNNSAKVRMLQYLVGSVIIGGIVSLIHYDLRMNKVKSELKHNISNIRLSIHNAKLIYKGSYDELDNAIFEEQSIKIINAMKQIHPKDLFSYSMPPSWFSSIQSRLNTLLGRAYNTVVFRFIMNKFNNDLKMLVSDYTNDKISYKKNFHPLHSREFIALNSYITKIAKLENIHYKIKRVPHLRNINDVIYIMKHLLNIDVSKSLIHNKRVFQNALKHVQVDIHSFDSYKKNIRIKSTGLFDKFINHALEYDKVIPNITKIESILERIEQKENYDIESLTSYFNQLTSVFNKQDLLWISSNKSKFGEQINHMLYKAQDSNVLGLKIAQNMKEKIELKIKQLKQKVVKHRLPMIGVIFQDNDNGQLDFSKDFAEFQGMLNLLAGQSFMKNTDYKINPDLKSNIVKWNLLKLAEIVKIINEFNKFSSHKILYKHEKITHAMAMVTCSSVIKNIKYNLVSSQSQFDNLESDNTLLSNIHQNLDEANKYLIKILLFVKNRNSNLFTELKNVLQKQNILFLEKLDQLLQKKDLYNISNSDLYLNGTKEDIQEYIAKQQEQIKYLSELSIPSVQILSKISDIGLKIYSPILNKWSEINDAVVRSKEGKSNQIKSIETLIITSILNKKNCDYMIADLDQNSTSYFERKKHSILLSMSKKCLFDNYNTIKVQYRKIVQYFNQYMAHRFPFNKSANVEITPEEAKQFLAIWNEKSMNLDLLSHYLKPNHAWIAFLKRTQSIIPWLESMIDGKKHPGSFMVTLRTNRDQEKLGDHIAIWDLKFGDKTIHMNMDPQEIELKNYNMHNILRLSKESKHSFENGKSYEVKYNGFFGIVKLINKFCANHCKQNKQLRLSIPLLSENSNLTVWCDIELKGKLKEWPTFPKQAPNFPKSEVKLCIN